MQPVPHQAARATQMSVRYPEQKSTGAALNEADTCRQLVVPKLQAAGWNNDPHSIAEQRTITDGRIGPGSSCRQVVHKFLAFGNLDRGFAKCRI